MTRTLSAGGPSVYSARYPARWRWGASIAVLVLLASATVVAMHHRSRREQALVAERRAERKPFEKRMVTIRAMPPPESARVESADTPLGAAPRAASAPAPAVPVTGVVQRAPSAGSPPDEQAEIQSTENTPENAAEGAEQAQPQPAANQPAPLLLPVPCGPVSCSPGLVCCNDSCGICTNPGEGCSQRICGMPTVPASASCGNNTCNVGYVCCNASCGTCVPPGARCDPRPCSGGIEYPFSESCGMSTCNVGMECCNASCGICVRPGESCSREVCG